MFCKHLIGPAAILMVAIFMAPAAGAATLKKVNVDTLNVRSGPSTGYRVLSTLSKGTVVRVESTSGSWSRITSPMSGYVYAAYLSSGTKAVVNVSTVNVRRGPGTGYGIIKTLSKGAVVYVVSTSGSWKRIGSPVIGWVYGAYVSSGSTTTTTSGITKAPKSNVYGLTRNPYNGFLHLPSSGYGWYSGAISYNRWGVPRMVNGFIQMGRHWANGYPGVKGKRLRSNAISRKNGGYFPPHATHRCGRNVDLSPITDSGNAGIVYYYQRSYSRYYTQKFVNLQRAVWYLRNILFNDTRIAGPVYSYRGHSNHLHTTINY